SPGKDYLHATDLFKAGKYQEAEMKLRDALQGQPEFPEAYYLLGQVLAMTGRPVEAEGSLLTAVQLRPNFVQARQLLAMLYCERKEYVAAKDTLHKALEFDPENGLSYLYLGNALEGLNDNLEAMSAYERALRSTDDHSESHSKAKTSLGLLHLKLATSH